eukprot:1879549-Alexandrium_andersonii.AAC.1
MDNSTRTTAPSAALYRFERFSATLSGFLRPLSGGATDPRTPPKSACGALRKRRFSGVSGGAVAPPERG